MTWNAQKPLRTKVLAKRLIREGFYANTDPNDQKTMKNQLTFLGTFLPKKFSRNPTESLNIFQRVQFEWGTANEGD
ncbi:MAG: hypothetical protein GY737_30015 [Desulfobacteraceae bacterium]|nr:hypothetical protein [Desulfobacteraceae bacterium]